MTKNRRPKNALGAWAEEINASNQITLTETEAAICDVLTKRTDGQYDPHRHGKIETESAAMHPDFDHFECDEEAIRDLSQRAMALEATLDTLPEEQAERMNKISRKAWGDFGDDLNLTNMIALAGLLSVAQKTCRLIRAISPAETLLLKEQRELYWSGRGRNPDWRAKQVAFSVAMNYRRSTGELPTYGSNAGYPSTEFGRAVQEIFEILEIDRGWRSFAEGAAKQIRELEQLLADQDDISGFRPYFQQPNRLS